MSDQKDVILEVSNLDVFYGDLQANSGISLKIEKGSTVSLIGANGAGKSTLLNSIMGLNKPRAGKIIWKGQDITGMPTNRIVSKGISLTPEGSCIFEDMTVKENLLLGSWHSHAKKAREELLEQVFEVFPVFKQKINQLGSFLSGGQRQMLAIGRAIMASPELIICDELSLGLAPVIIKDIYASLRRISERGVTFLIVEQEVKRSLKNTDYAYVMVKGRIVMEGKCSKLPEDQVCDAYFGINEFA